MTLTEAEIKAAADKAAADKAASDAAAGQAGKGGEGNDNDGEIKIPLYKFQKVNEEAKALKAKLDEFEAERAKINNAKLAEEGKYKELVAAKEAEASSLKNQLAEMQKSIKDSRITSLIKDEIMKHNPRDIGDVLPLINKKDLTITEDGEEISISGLKEILEKLKKSKDYLFGAPGAAKNDNKNNAENGKAASGSIESIEAEYRILLVKPDLTIPEQAKLKELALKLKELRAVKK